jgi:glucokinase
MLAEIAAANAAFAVIKAALKNGKELADVSVKAFEYFDYKAKLQEGANEKAGGRPLHGRTDIEEFMALEQLRKQESELKEEMIYAGRPGMWEDWQRFQAMLARKKREEREAAERAHRAMMEKRQQALEVFLAALFATAAFVGVVIGIALI